MLEIGTRLECIQEHQDGDFRIGRMYRVVAHQVWGENVDVRIRDDKRQRKDFNFIPTSKNFIWHYFKPL